MSDHAALSVSALSHIFCGTVLCCYGGIYCAGIHISSGLTTIAAENSKCSITWTVLHLDDPDKHILLNPTAVSNLGRFINGVAPDEQHKVNVTPIKVVDEDGYVRIIFVALRDIKPGEHLFYFYGDDYDTEWEGGGFMTMEEFSSLDWEEVPDQK